MIIDKDNIKILLIILVLGLGIGYAYINSDLNINGTAQVNSANWDVHWANIQVTNGSVSASSPTISNQTTVNYNVTLNIPGDYYEFTVDAVNGGAIDTMVDTMEFKLNGTTMLNPPEYLNYTVTYSDGVPLEQNHLLAANTTEKYKIRVEYRTDIELNQLPATNQALNLQFAVAYRQATEDAEEVDHGTMVYTISSTESYIGQAMPSSITQYSSASEAMAAFSNRPIYLKHLIRNNIIEESYVEFVITPAMAQSNTGVTAGTYSLRGLDTRDGINNICKPEYYDSANDICLSPYYATNKETLLSAFGTSNCVNYSSFVHCSVSGLESYANEMGNVYANDFSWNCTISSEGGSSYCDENNVG